jgi:recombination DNA repair RAD52 pathway protein
MTFTPRSRSFTFTQVTQLLKPINRARVMKDGKGHNHLSQQDVIAHLIRVFGFGNFDTEVLAVECLFEHNRPTDDGKVTKRWDVGYRALVRLTVRNPDGDVVCRYENGSTATAQNQSLGDGHDLAYKSAISLAVKRCAINLGDQFGLSLYNKGQTDALVMATMVRPTEPQRDGDCEEAEDIQKDVPEQVSSGDHEGATLDEPDDNGPVIGLGAALADKAKP